MPFVTGNVRLHFHTYLFVWCISLLQIQVAARE